VAGPAYSLAAEPAALADGHCRWAVVLPLDGVGGLGLAARPPSLGRSFRMSHPSPPDTAAPRAGFAAKDTVFLRLGAQALEWRPLGGNPGATARLAGVGRNRAALVACFGRALETHPVGRPRPRPEPGAEAGSPSPARGRVAASTGVAVSPKREENKGEIAELLPISPVCFVTSQSVHSDAEGPAGGRADPGQK
jgi:hypothetical protein